MPAPTARPWPSKPRSRVGSASSTWIVSRSVTTPAASSVRPSSRATTRVPPGQVRRTRDGRAAAVSGSRRTRSAVTSRSSSHETSRVGNGSSASAIQVVPGSPSMAASAPARGSATAVLEARAAMARPSTTRASSAGPGRGRPRSATSSYDAGPASVTSRSIPPGSSSATASRAAHRTSCRVRRRSPTTTQPDRASRSARSAMASGWSQRASHSSGRAGSAQGRETATPGRSTSASDSGRSSTTPSTRTRPVLPGSRATVRVWPGPSGSSWVVPASVTTRMRWSSAASGPPITCTEVRLRAESSRTSHHAWPAASRAVRHAVAGSPSSAAHGCSPRRTGPKASAKAPAEEASTEATPSSTARVDHRSWSCVVSPSR
ncbi:unannotated protein [freshwater metagenome]|uniref:Unannotated protein n=1 Tax=freshwater metagenome TaxID=449393 RepID=A0A6J6T3U4_9ZZZZ